MEKVLPEINAGKSTCPICGRKWLVVPFDDCFIPNCGCYGDDTSENNPNRPCESCGMRHSFICEKIGKTCL